MALKKNATTAAPATEPKKGGKGRGASPAPAAPEAPATEPKKPGTALATRSAGAVSTNVASDEERAMFLADAANKKAFRKEDLAIPFLRVLQKNSPQVNKRDDRYVEGAEVGQFYQSVSQELWDGDEGIDIIIIYQTPSFIEWKPRDAGGGLVRDYGADGSILRKTVRNERNKNILPNGNEVVESCLYYVLVVDRETGTFDFAAFPLASTQLKKARKLNTRLGSLRAPVPGGRPNETFNPAFYYTVWHVGTVFETKDSFDWMGVEFSAEPVAYTKDLPNGLAIYRAAKDFEALVASGAAKADLAKEQVAEVEYVEETEEGEAVESVTGGSSSADDDEEF